MTYRKIQDPAVQGSLSLDRVREAVRAVDDSTSSGHAVPRVHRKAKLATAKRKATRKSARKPARR